MSEEHVYVLSTLRDNVRAIYGCVGARHVHLTDWDWDSIPGGIGLHILLLFSEPTT